MDPLSVTASCVSLVAAITKTSIVVTAFVRGVRGARGELDAVSRELLSLKTVLELLADDASDEKGVGFPETLRKQVVGIVTNCSGVVGEIETELGKHEGTMITKAARWAAIGHGDVNKLRSSLEAHKSALEIALDMVALTLAKEIKADTGEILSETKEIKADTTQILEEIARLQQQLPRDTETSNTSGFLLERYLDNLTSYAETVCDDFSDGTVTPVPEKIDEYPEIDGVQERKRGDEIQRVDKLSPDLRTQGIASSLQTSSQASENDPESVHRTTSMEEHTDLRAAIQATAQSTNESITFLLILETAQKAIDLDTASEYGGANRQYRLLKSYLEPLHYKVKSADGWVDDASFYDSHGTYRNSEGELWDLLHRDNKVKLEKVVQGRIRRTNTALRSKGDGSHQQHPGEFKSTNAEKSNSPFQYLADRAMLVQRDRDAGIDNIGSTGSSKHGVAQQAVEYSPTIENNVDQKVQPNGLEPRILSLSKQHGSEQSRMSDSERLALEPGATKTSEETLAQFLKASLPLSSSEQDSSSGMLMGINNGTGHCIIDHAPPIESTRRLDRLYSRSAMDDLLLKSLVITSPSISSAELGPNSFLFSRIRILVSIRLRGWTPSIDHLQASINRILQVFNDLSTNSIHRFELGLGQVALAVIAERPLAPEIKSYLVELGCLNSQRLPCIFNGKHAIFHMTQSITHPGFGGQENRVQTVVLHPPLGKSILATGLGFRLGGLFKARLVITVTSGTKLETERLIRIWKYAKVQPEFRIGTLLTHYPEDSPSLRMKAVATKVRDFVTFTAADGD